MRARDLVRRGGDGPSARTGLVQKISDLARKEAAVALPAAKRAATHGLQAFWKKFSEEYAKERKKR